MDIRCSKRQSKQIYGESSQFILFPAGHPFSLNMDGHYNGITSSAVSNIFEKFPLSFLYLRSSMMNIQVSGKAPLTVVP